MKRFALIGHPVVGHSVSPVMIRAAFEALGLAGSYDAIDVAEGGGVGRVAAELRAGQRAGINITVPHKLAAVALADEVGESAAKVGAANVWVRADGGRIRAENTDAAAIVAVLRPLLRRKRRALVLGSGGAARAALVACEELGVGEVTVTSRSWTTLEEARSLGAMLPAIALPVKLLPWGDRDGVSASGSIGEVSSSSDELFRNHPIDLVIQATSAGMHGADGGDAICARVPWERLDPEAIAFDVVYRPRWTPFLVTARERGLVAVDGLGMLVEQAALALKMWLGVEAPRDVMRLAAERGLAG